MPVLHEELRPGRSARRGYAVRAFGISYDTGFTSAGTTTREPFDPAVVGREMQVIRGELRCDAVRITGGDRRRLETRPTPARGPPGGSPTAAVAGRGIYAGRILKRSVVTMRHSIAGWKPRPSTRKLMRHRPTVTGVPAHSAWRPGSTRSTALATPKRRSAGAWHRSATRGRCGWWICAGTGILTGALARLGADVVAVEPDQAMLAELRRQLPGARAVAGSAEALPLPDQSADAVLCGQAMHWFDLDRALPEIARVLAPGGVLAGLWNVDDDRVGWVAGLTAISNSGTTLSRWRSTPDPDTERATLHAGSTWFAPAEEREFGNGQLRSTDSLVAAIATKSQLLIMDEAERARTLAALRAFLHRQPETSAGEFTLPLVTVALRAVRRPRLPPQA
jgi:SAM-dependent methyltransferase